MSARSSSPRSTRTIPGSGLRSVILPLRYGARAPADAPICASRASNRRNARLSNGPVTEEGQRRSRQNAVRHGLTAETVIDALEDAEDYAAFEMAVTADYDAQSAVERELVLRLASVLWRLRRATAIERGLFKIQAKQLLQFRCRRQAHHECQKIIDTMYRNAATTEDDMGQDEDAAAASAIDPGSASTAQPAGQA